MKNIDLSYLVGKDISFAFKEAEELFEKNLEGKHAVILGRSNLNGKPMAQLLLKENCTITILHSKSKNLDVECKRADILVVAVGVSQIVKGNWIKKDAVVIDVGINKERRCRF